MAAAAETPLVRFGLASFLLVCAGIGAIAGTDPKLAIGLAIGAVFVLLAFTQLSFALVLLCVEPLALGFSSSKVIRIGAIILLVAWFAAVAHRRRPRETLLAAQPGLCLALAGLMAWVLLSITWAEDPGQALIQTGGYAMGAAILLIAFTAVHRRGELRYVLGLVLLGLVATGAYALISSPPVESPASPRLSGDLDANVLAAILIAGSVLSVGVAALWRRQSPAISLTALAGGAFCFAVSFLTVSRGGLIAIGACLVAAIVFGGRWRPRVALVALLVALGSLYYIVALAPAENRERILNTVQGQSTILEGRTTIWQVAMRMGEANPVHGVGAGNFPISAKHYLLRPGSLPRSDLIIDTPKVAHNIYLEIFAELGVIGLTLFLLVVFFSLRSMLRAARAFRKRGDEAAEILARSLLVATIGMLTASFFISIELDKHLWLLLGLGPALLHIARGRADEPTTVP